MQRLLCSASLVALVFGAPAYATVVDPTVLLANYNLITSANAISNGDLEGAIFVGAGLSSSSGTITLFNNSGHLPSNRTSYILGSNGTHINVNSGGSLYIGGANSGNINLNGGGNKLQIDGANGGNINGSSGSIIAINGGNGGVINTNGGTYLPLNNTTIVPPMTVTQAVNSLTNYSAQLAAWQANGAIVTAPNSVSFQYAGAGPAVFSLTAAQLTADLTNANISFLLGNPNAPVVVNVDLQGHNWFEPSSAHFASGTPLQNVLFNFYNGSGALLNFTTMWETSILAIDSAVINSTPIEGSVAALVFVGNGELHNYPLLVSIPSNNPPPPPPSVPEPATFAFLLAGLLGLFGVVRRKKGA